MPNLMIDGTAPPREISETDKMDWKYEAWRLFGYSLGCQTNINNIAEALEQIAEILNDHDDVSIIVMRRPG